MQELDTRLDQLRHQLEHLPETARLAELTGARDGFETRIRETRTRVEDLSRAQRKADADVEQVKARRTRDRQRLDQGLVNSPKDLERMQHEMVSLERRIAELEDAELEVMEQLEGAQNELADLETGLGDLQRQIAEAEGSRATKSENVESERAQMRGRRDELAAGLPDELLALYDKLRAQKGGVGAAALRARRCGGCSLELNAADLGEIAKAPADQVLRCEECSRILVRTSESGL
ncbi:MAG TPA: C4-type zinc ribbon domain-containing protein [Nocardioidaceae bacterium]|nr:C4-type zinc ribbon domain-containing protein [Nocardioidaceae bacterium]